MALLLHIASRFVGYYRRSPLWKWGFGNIGEWYASVYLKRNGVVILTKNFRFRKYQVDIIGIEKKTLCAFEVKTRWNSWLPLSDLVTDQQQRSVVRGLKEYCRHQYYFPEAIRIDKVGVFISIQNRRLIKEVQWLKGTPVSYIDW